MFIGGIAGALLALQVMGYFLGVALVIQFRQTIQNLPLCAEADGVAGLPADLVEAVIKAADLLNPILPPVRTDSGLPT